MTQNHLESILESFSKTEKDLWNIVTKRMDLDDVPDYYLDSLVNLIRKLVVNIAPFYDTETYQSDLSVLNVSLDVKSMTDDPSPVVNYIEAVAIKKDIWEYLKKNTELGNYLKDDPIIAGVFVSQEDNPEMEGIVACTETGLIHRYSFYYGSLYELSNDVKKILETWFETRSSWSEKEQRDTIRSLKAKQPAAISRHDWHYQVIDYLEWYCLKNNMTFYLTKDLYFSDDAETVFEKEIHPLIGEALIDGIEGRMMMQVGRYGTTFADTTIKHYAELLQVIQKYRGNMISTSIEPFVIPRRSELYSPDDTFVSETAADLALLMEDACAKNIEKRQRFTVECLAHGEGKKWFTDFYTEIANITGIKACNPEDDEDEPSGRRVNDAEKEIALNCYLTTYDVLGVRKAQEAHDDVFSVLIDFNENDTEKYQKEENRKALYDSLKASFEKHVDTEPAEIAAHCLLSSLMSSVYFQITKEKERIRDNYAYLRASELIDSRGYRPSNLIQDAEKKYADIIRGFGFDLDSIRINRTAEKIQKDVWTLRRSIDNIWTTDSHKVLHDIIRDNLSKVLKISWYATLEESATNTIYREVCNEFEIAPMIWRERKGENDDTY